MKLMHSFLASALVASGICAHSQTMDRQMTVSVPFDFTVRDTHLNAGPYRVKQVGPIIIMTSQRGKTANVLSIQEYTAKPATHSSLTFTRRGGEYVLSQVRNQGSNTELDAVVGKHSPHRLDASAASPEVEVTALGTR
jgi:hypothetical protein